jgi:hypothetical protein
VIQGWKSVLGKEQKAILVKTKVFIVSEKGDGSIMRNIASHNEEFASLLSFSWHRVDTMSQHLCLEESLSKYLENRLLRWHIDVKHSFGIT